MIQGLDAGEFAAVRRGRDGEPLPKQRALDRPVPINCPDVTRIENILAPTLKQAPEKKDNKKPKKKKITPGEGFTGVENHAQQYNVISSLAHANAGIISGLLLRGDAKDAEKLKRCSRTHRFELQMCKKLEVQVGLASPTPKSLFKGMGFHT